MNFRFSAPTAKIDIWKPEELVRLDAAAHLMIAAGVSTAVEPERVVSGATPTK